VIKIFAQLESILLDPVYSGKGATGLFDLIRKGRFERGRGFRAYRRYGALFGYSSCFEDDSANKRTAAT